MIGPGEFGSSVLGSPEVLLHWRSRANDAGICGMVAVSESVFPFRIKEGRGGHVKVTAVIVKLHSFPNLNSTPIYAYRHTAAIDRAGAMSGLC